MMWLFVVVIVLLLLYIYKITAPPRKIVEFAQKVPGPEMNIVVHWKRLFNRRSGSNLVAMTKLYDKYGPVFRIWCGNKLTICLTDPDDIQVFLSSTTYFQEKSFLIKLSNSWLGNTNMLTSSGDVWQIHRKLLTPSFHFKIVERAVPMMLRNANILCDRLEIEVNQPSFDVEEYIEKLTLDNIAEIAMGIELSTQSFKHENYLHSIERVLNLVEHRMQSPMLHSETIFKLTNTGRDFFKHVKVVRDEGRKIIEQRKKLLQENNDSEEEIISRKKVKPFLDSMLTQDYFNDIDMENEVQLFMVADKALNEIRKTIFSVEGEPTYNDFLTLKYLESVIKESMRLYPPVSIISRKVDHDVTLSSGYVLPSGSFVDIITFLAHRNKKYFKEPEKFNPERFEKIDSERNPYAYIPFSAGIRNCIGQKFAMSEIKITIAMLLLKYEFTVDENAAPITIEDLENWFTLKCTRKLPIIIRRRKMINICSN